MEGFSLILIAVAIIMCSMLVVKRATSKTLDIFDPYYITWIVYFLVFVVAPMVWIARGKETAFGYEVMDGLPYASLLFTLGFLAFSLVNIYLCNRDDVARRQLRHPFADLKDVLVGGPSGRQVVICSQVGMIIVTIVFTCAMYLKGTSVIAILTFQTVGSELLVQDNSVFVNILCQAYLAYVPLLMLLYIYQKRLRAVVYTEALLVLLLYISRGYRFIVLILVFAPIVFNYLKHHKRPTVSQIGAAFVIVFLVVALIGVTRDSLRSGSAIASFTIDDMLDSILVNIEVFFPYYREVLIVPDGFPYANGVSFAYLLFMFIPRSIWPTKPLAPYGMLAEYMFGPAARTGMAYIHVGEFYLNFGPIGVVVCMGVFGAVLAYMKRLYERYESTRYLLIYSILFTFLIQYLTRGDFTSILVQLLFLFLPVFIVFRLTGKHSVSSSLGRMPKGNTYRVAFNNYKGVNPTSNVAYLRLAESERLRLDADK